MKISRQNTPHALALIDHIKLGFDSIKEHINRGEEITDEIWMRAAAPLKEFGDLLYNNEDKLINSELTCSDCVFYSKVMMACMNPINEGARIFNPKDSYCDELATEYTEELEKKIKSYYKDK